MSKITAILIALSGLVVACGEIEQTELNGAVTATGPAHGLAAEAPPSDAASVDSAIGDLAAWPVGSSR